MRPQSAKAKGRKLQQLVRDEILADYPELTERDVRSTSMGASGVDVLLSERAVEKFPYSVECKRRAAMSVYDLWEDTTDNVATGTRPLLVIQQDRSDPLAVIDLRHFMELVYASNVSNRAGREHVPSEQCVPGPGVGRSGRSRSKIPASAGSNADKPDRGGRRKALPSNASE